MFCYVRTGFKLFDISFMFLFSRFEGSAGLTYIAPGKDCAIYLVYDISLFFRKWSIFGDGKCCSKVRSGFVVVLMPCRFSSLQIP